MAKSKTKITKVKIKKRSVKKVPPKNKIVRSKKIVIVKRAKSKTKKKIPSSVSSKKKTGQDQKRSLLLERIRVNLLAEKKKVETEISKPVPTLDSIDLDGDEIDEIQGKLLVEVSSQLKIRNQDRSRKIENAIQRIEMESYGTCDDCAEEIPEKRLEANPYVLTCVGCAELREIENQKGK